MPSISITLRSRGDLKRLAAADMSRRQAILADAAELGAEVVVREAKLLAPYKTGNLRAGIASTQVFSSPQAALFAVGHLKSVPYGKYVEYGTSRMAARPHIRPPMTTHADEISRVIVNTIRRGLLQ